MTRKELLKIAKPCRFNTDEVRAILEGRKTVTRRCVKYKYNNTEMRMHTDKYGTRLIEIQKDVEGETHGKNPDGSTWHKLLPYIEKKPPFKKGNILYIRETWHKYTKRVGNGEQCRLQEFYGYKASVANSEHANESWKPSIHMPKEAARIFLKVTDVRVERLQDIAIGEIRNEGLGSMAVYAGDKEISYKEWILLWNSTIKKSDLTLYGWSVNPWVWVIEFERIEPESEV